MRLPTNSLSDLTYVAIFQRLSLALVSTWWVDDWISPLYSPNYRSGISIAKTSSFFSSSSFSWILEAVDSNASPLTLTLSCYLPSCVLNCWFCWFMTIPGHHWHHWNALSGSSISSCNCLMFNSYNNCLYSPKKVQQDKSGKYHSLITKENTVNKTQDQEILCSPYEWRK